MNKENVVRETGCFYEVLQKSNESDFCGKSMFHTFSPTQRLEWLEQVRADLMELKAMARYLKK